MTSVWEAVIGLEVHVQLHTRSKLFSDAAVPQSEAANRCVDAWSAGHPGTLPVLNHEAVALAVRAGIATGCRIEEMSIFARKHYFYADLPRGYQITQYEHPICRDGKLEFPLGDAMSSCGIERIHIEEDTGKSVHEGAHSLLDYNRAGTPLVEIVSRPDLRTPDEASAWFRELRQVLVAARVTQGNLQHGDMRCDANISVRRKGETELRTRVEIKNLNSFRFVRDAIAFEIARQIAAYENHQTVWQETRSWDEHAQVTRVLRRKEKAADYRYFPEPDLPPLRLTREWIVEQQAGIPELPSATRARLHALGLSFADSVQLSQADGLLVVFDDALHSGADPVALFHLINALLVPSIHQEIVKLQHSLIVAENVVISAPAFGELQVLIQQGVISHSIARQVWELMLREGGSAAEHVAQHELQTVRDTAALQKIVDEVLAQHPEEVARYRSGKVALLGFLAGKAMKATAGKADPRLLSELLRTKLGPTENS
jgi:aspartyl-tRNA(Asn)/glutamyl-tRNA(Gln) amidotransferase subunit B